LRLGASVAVGAGVTACSSVRTGGGSALPVANTASAQLPPFDPGLPAGPSTRLSRGIAWANTYATSIFDVFAGGIKAASDARHLDYLTANANGDLSADVSELQTFLARGVGSIVVQPLDQTSQAPLLQQAIDAGVFLQGIITWPSTLQIAAKQYAIGFAQGKAAADYVNQHLGGRAKVVYLQETGVDPQLVLRRQGAYDGLRTGGSGVHLVKTADPPTGSSDAGYTAMLSIIEAHPDIEVVIGEDGYVVGAYRALSDVGKLKEQTYLSGVDGDTEALELVAQGTPYRASFAFPWALMGYGLGELAADWIEGRQVPRIMTAPAPALDSPAKVADYRAAAADPGSIYADREVYVRAVPLLGNISYATRQTIWQQAYVPA
jgi:ribose transport system substrate-binding protein